MHFLAVPGFHSGPPLTCRGSDSPNDSSDSDSDSPNASPRRSDSAGNDGRRAGGCC